MATAKMHFQGQRRRRPIFKGEPILRLLQTQRSDELFPVLLEEIVARGYVRAAVLEASFDGRELKPVAALNWQLPQLEKLAAGLPQGHSLAALLEAGGSAALPKTALHPRALYVHPLVYANRTPCWEASRGSDCLAVQNSSRRSEYGNQACSVCDMRGYAALVVVELRRHNSEAELDGLDELIEFASVKFSHLLKAEHYYNRLCDKGITIAQMRAMMHRMAEPALLSDIQHRTLLENKVSVERRMLEIEKFAAAGRLAATIAHEINNPMEAIKNAVYLLADAVSEDAMPVYNILQSETERVARVVRQMLGLYRDTEPLKPLNVNTIIEDTLLLLQRQLQRSNVLVEADLGVLPEAVIAADQIRQVFSNMIINARDAMPNGGRLRIRSRHMAGRDGLPSRIRILIVDNGIGIPREIIHDIFEPFVTTKGEKGTGLGLWIVKGIIQNHAGKLVVRSRLGKGTIFRIDLPLAKP
jgi:signal transduction histidine kinase